MGKLSFDGEQLAGIRSLSHSKSSLKCSRRRPIPKSICKSRKSPNSPDGSRRKRVKFAGSADICELKGNLNGPSLQNDGSILNSFYSTFLITFLLFLEWRSNELAFPVAHFEAGLQLPLWPEVVQAFKYFGLVPAQVNSNDINALVGFTCYMREEGIEFDLTSFRKILNLKETDDGVVFFSSVCFRLVDILNKVYHWTDKFMFVRAAFGSLPLAPVQRSENAYKPSKVGGDALAIYEMLKGKDFDVLYLRRRQDQLVYIMPETASSNPVLSKSVVRRPSLLIQNVSSVAQGVLSSSPAQILEKRAEKTWSSHTADPTPLERV
ncbi:hypothetical protein KSP39_PZI009919 [Platanthera zijinensis]|uniref:Uncharacterized protein n=1 Tax=Platanthera zijinensis TaxID=2320716 RepID=A0AAP0G794_9ASPA